MTPQVIIISGPSASGKTTLAKTLQETLLPSVWLSFSVDTVIYSLPATVLDRCNLENDWSGVDGQALFSGAVSSLRALVDSGNRVIFDVVLMSQIDIQRLLGHLSTLEVVSVALRSSWAEIKKRTIERGDRTHAEAQRSFDACLRLSDSDLVFDTSEFRADEIAVRICRHINDLAAS